MQKKRDMKITIPEGHFEGNCDSCFFGKRNNKDAEGRILCKGEPGGYKYPYEKNDCRYYTGRVQRWIGIIVMSYVLITVLVIILEALIK